MIKKLVSYSLLLCLLCAPAFAYRGKGYKTINGAADVATVTSSFNGNLSSADTDVQRALDTIDNLSISGAPSTLDYLVGTATASLSSEIVVGTSPGGELGGTWASPTLDDSVTVTGWDLGASIGTTPAADDNDTSLATSAYVQTELTAYASDTVTLTNKRVTPRIGTVADAATITPTGDSSDMYTVTALAQAATIAAPSGTPTNGQRLIIRFLDNATGRALTWNAIYRAVGITLPTTTTASKTLYVGFIYNSADSKWDGVATVVQA